MPQPLAAQLQLQRRGMVRGRPLRDAGDLPHARPGPRRIGAYHLPRFVQDQIGRYFFCQYRRRLRPDLKNGRTVRRLDLDYEWHAGCWAR
jgi:hypothetical protein